MIGGFGHECSYSGCVGAGSEWIRGPGFVDWRVMFVDLGVGLIGL